MEKKPKNYAFFKINALPSDQYYNKQIHSPGTGDIVDSGIWLLYRPASLFSLAGRYDNIFPPIRTMNLATGQVENRVVTLTHLKWFILHLGYLLHG